MDGRAKRRNFCFVARTHETHACFQEVHAPKIVFIHSVERVEPTKSVLFDESKREILVLAAINTCACKRLMKNITPDTARETSQTRPY